MKHNLLLACIAVSTIASAQWSTSGNKATRAYKLGTTNNISLRLYTNNSQKMVITPSGNVGLGIAYPQYRFHMDGRMHAFSPDTTIAGFSALDVDDQARSIGVYGESKYGTGVKGKSVQFGVHGVSTGSYYGVYGTSEDPGGTGVFGLGFSYGVQGRSVKGHAVHGESDEQNGGRFISASGIGLYAATTNGSFAGYFNGAVFMGSAFTASDKNLKQDIQDIGDALLIVNKLKPKHYFFKPTQALNLPEGRHYGLIAQEVETVLPALVQNVSHTEKEQAAIKAINYTELMPIMLKAIQEQQEQIEALRREVKELKGERTSALLSSASLEMVSPNPVKAVANIRYSVPAGNHAQLAVSDANGRQIKKLQLSRSGVVQFDTSTLAGGVYFYALVVDGKTVETRKMTVVK